MRYNIFVAGPERYLIGGVANFIDILLNHKEELCGDWCELIYIKHGKTTNPKMNKFIFLLYIKQYFNLIFNIIKFKPDLIHLNPSIEFVSMIRDSIYLRTAKWFGIKVLFFIRGWDDEYFNHNIKKGPLSKYYLKSLKMADRIIVLSKDFKDKLINLGIDKNKIDILSTMVETNKFYTKKDFSPPYNLLFLARFDKKKGLYETVEAMKYILKVYPDTKLYLVGDGPEFVNIKNYVMENGLNNSIILTGYLKGEEKYKIYKKAHVFIFPSYTEGFPNVILEAMAAGLPIVTTPVGGLKYAFSEGINGCLIKSMPPDPKEIADKVIYLLSHPQIMDKISENNKREAKTKYDISVVLEKIKRIYLDMLLNENNK